MRGTTSDSEDTGAASGWSIADTGLVLPSGSWQSSGEVSWLIAIDGDIITNNPATGAPAITGTRRVGQTLTASTTAIADTDGLSSVTYAYQWVRVDGATETEVGTDAATYTPVAADAGKRLRVEVSFTDDVGFAEALASATVPVRAAEPPASCPAFSLPGGHRQVWTGTVTVGSLPASNHGYLDGGEGSLSDTEFTLATTDYTIDGIATGGSGSLLFNLDAGPTEQAANLFLHVCGERYALAEASYSSTAHSYSWSDAGLDWSSLTGETRVLYLTWRNTPATGAPAVTGRRRVGQTLTAATTAIADANGLDNVTYAYRWVRIDGATETEVGTDAATYTPVAADAGKRLGVEVSFTDDAGFAETLASATVPVRAAEPPASCPAFSLPGGHRQVWTGTVTVGANVVGGTTVSHGYLASGSVGALSDTDFELAAQGRTASHTIESVSVLSSSNTSAGALGFYLDTSPTERQAANLVLHVCGERYELAEASYSSTEHSYSWSDAGLDWSSLTGSTRVLRLTLRANTPASGAAISGRAQAGSTLTAPAARIRDADGLDDAEFSYQWIRVDGADETDIDAATRSAYTLGADDVGKRVRVRVSFTDDRLNEETVTSPAFPMTGTVRAAPVMVGPGELLSATLTVKDLGGLSVGCAGSGSSNRCSDTSVLTDDDFTLGGTTFTITDILLVSGNLQLTFDNGIPSAVRSRLSLVAGTTTFAFGDADFIDSETPEWTSTGLSWSAGDSVSIVIRDAGTGDVTPPALALDGPSVPAAGVIVSVPFDEALDAGALPPAGAFTLTAGGTALRITRVGVNASDAATLELAVSPVIRQGRTVTLSYTDPTSGNDADALQDEAGNDVATFEHVAVANGSTLVGEPANPSALGATAVGGTRIDLAWTAPDDIGASAITGYRIEWSADGSAPWTALETDTGTVNTTYSDTGLDSETTRHYRVAAINAQGTGPWSDTASATTDDIERPVPVSAATTGNAISITFDEALDLALGNLPPKSAFVVTADGNPIDVAQVSIVAADPKTLLLNDLTPSIRSGQVVRVRYADPTAGDDTAAIQDDDGNDAASFSLGPDSGDVLAVTNSSTEAGTTSVPGAPRVLDVEEVSATTYTLSWLSPLDWGGTAITGYRIESCETDCDQESGWSALVADTDSADTTYTDSTVTDGTTRYYRVSAINAQGTGDPSDVKSTARAGAISLSLTPDSVEEGGTLTWTVTATTAENEQPEAGASLSVQVTSVDSPRVEMRGETIDLEATPGSDYPSVDTTVTFVRGDFARQSVDGEQRYVATMTGTVPITDDVTVEWVEEIRLNAAVTRGGGWAVETAQATANIASDTDDRLGFRTTANVDEIYEGETRQVTINVTSLPDVTGCVAPFPFEFELASSSNDARPDTDYNWEPELEEARGEVAACEKFSKDFTVHLRAEYDSDEDDAETLTLTSGPASGEALSDAIGSERFLRYAELFLASGELVLEDHTITIRERREVVIDAPDTVEMGEDDTYRYEVRLAKGPTGTVEVRPVVTGSDVSVSPASLSFTRSDWHRSQTVTITSARDDNEDEETVTIRHRVSGADYGSVSARSITVRVLERPTRMGQVRLRESQNQSDGSVIGRLEVGYHAVWGTVCDDLIKLPFNQAPQMACRMLGFETGDVVENRNSAAFSRTPAQDVASYYPGKDLASNIVPIWLDDLDCRAGSGSPNRLDQCSHVGIGLHNCGRSDDVWLQCSGTLPSGEPVLPQARAFAVANNAHTHERGSRDHNGHIRPGAGNPLTFKVILVPPVTGTDTATVEYRTADFSGPQVLGGMTRGRAVAGEDYTPVSGTLTFSAIETPAVELRGYGAVMQQLVRVTVLNDTVEDSNEALRFMLENPSSGNVLDRSEGYGLIYNSEDEGELTAAFSEAPEGHGGEAFTTLVTFSEDVVATADALSGALTASGGEVTGVTRRDEGDSRYWTVAVTPTNASDPITLSLNATADCNTDGSICTNDGRQLEGPTELTVAAEAPALGEVEVSGVAQVGNTLEASASAEATWQWLRGEEEIEGATEASHTLTAADVGHAVSVRATRGDQSVTSTATGPVWSAASHPAAVSGEEEILRTTITLGSGSSERADLAGYADLTGFDFGEIEDASFTEGETAYVLKLFMVNHGGDFGLATSPSLAGTDLVAYWNGHRIDSFSAETAPGGEATLSGETPQDDAEILRYTNGSSDGVKIGVTLRRKFEPVRIVQARITSTPGENGTWDTGESIEAQVRFEEVVRIQAAPGYEDRKVEIIVDTGRSTSPRVQHTGGSGTNTLSFAYTVDEIANGVSQARLFGGTLYLNGLRIVDEAGRDADVRLRASPQVESVALRADASGDRAWTSGESIEVELTFNEDVTVADGTPTVSVNVGEETLALDYASGSGEKTLVFSKAVGEGERLTGIAIAANSLALGGATIASEGNGMEAALGHSGTEATAAPDATTPLTASFTGLPEGHRNGNFTFKLVFSETLKSDFGYRTLFDKDDGSGAISVTNGSLVSIERIVKQGDERNRSWRIWVAPEEDEEVTVSLPASTGCTADEAICTGDGRGLSGATSATVPRGELDAPTVSMSPGPKEHDGRTDVTVAVRFSAEPKAGYSWTTFRDHTVDVRQGESRITPHVWRLDRPSNRQWAVRITPASKADIVVTVAPKASCEADGAICTSDGKQLSNTATRTILGPVAVSVADAEVREGADATMDFVVTLSRAALSELTVDYATSAGTATTNEDYTETSGTLTFAIGDTTKTISVPVLEDSIDDDGETFTLTLSNVVGGNAYLADATATGTIHNVGPMPRAWLTRFGRTVASQAVEAIGQRAESGHAGNAVQVGGIGLSPGGEVAEEERTRLGIDDLAWNRADETQSMSIRELLLGSAFSLGAGGEHGAPLVGAWGRFEHGRFEAEADGLTMDGDVTTGFVGADVARDRWLAGLALSFSDGKGDFAASEGTHSGSIESSLTSVYPYGRIGLNERVDVWGLVGMGSGELTLLHGQTREDRSAISTHIGMRMGALAVRGEVLTPGEARGLSVNLRSDAFWVRMDSDEVRNEDGYLGATQGEANRVRLIVEGSRAFDTGNGILTPSAEVGVRHDGGDAETGAGLEAGAGLQYTSGAFTVEGRVRGLVAHEEAGYEEWGASGTVRLDPSSSGRGLSLSIAPSMGNAGSGTGALWSAGDARVLAPDQEFEAGRRLEAQVGYGLGGPQGLGLVTPYTGLSLGEGGNRTWRTGARWQLAPEAEATFGLEATRNEGAGETGPVNAVELRAELRW